MEVMRNEKTVMSINKHDSFVFEHNRSVYIPDAKRESFVETYPNGPTAVGMDFTFPSKTVRFTGLAERMGPMNIPDTVGSATLRLYCRDGYSTYGSVPLLIGHEGPDSAAIFWPNPSDTFFDIRTIEDGRKARILSEGNFLDFFVFAYPIKEITLKFTQLVGRPFVPPLFALGFHQCKWGYKTQEDVQHVIDGYDSHNIPLDVMWLDIDHLKGHAPFEFDHTQFPAPEKLTDALAAKQRQMVRICDPHLPTQADHIQYQEAKRLGYFVRQQNGKDDFVSKCWPGDSSWPDFWDEKARDWYSTKYYYNEGRDFTTPNMFFWNDMNEIATLSNTLESAFPKQCRLLNGLETREAHSLYGLLQSAGTHKGLLNRNPHIGKEPHRPFVLSRSWFAGSQKYTWVWTGDNSPNWEHMEGSVRHVLVAGLIGMPFIGADIGGFGGKTSGELETRWIQLACWMYPFFRSHCSINAPNREPWTFPEPWYSRIVRAIHDRYMMIGLWYTHAMYATRTGRSPVVPLWYEWPEIESFHDRIDHVLFADSLLVVPVLNQTGVQVKVTTPPGIWYEFWNGTSIKGEFMQDLTWEEIPVYVRGGRVVPMYEDPGTVVSYDTITKPLTLLVACDEKNHSEGSLYLDDGLSYQFQTGEFIHRRFTFENGVVRSEKIDVEEARVPPALDKAYVEAIKFYFLNPDGSSRVVHVKGLHLLVKEEWTWKGFAPV
jgi:alpha 1,3-glucosidase